MIKFGYRCEEERYQPDILLQSAIEADRYGFDLLSISDHFHPWFHKNAAGGQAWVWMGAAAALTKRIALGTSVTVPIYRYHPAIVAQAFATLGEMFSGRIFLGLGTGEAMNEVPLGFEWSPFKERLERLEEAVKIIRLLWSQEFVTFSGKYFSLRGANLYTKPTQPVPIYVAASGPSAARLAGRLGDGFISGGGVRPDISKSKELLSLVEAEAKKTGRDASKIHKQITIRLSYDKDYDRALHSIERWLVQGLDEPTESRFMGKSIFDPRVMDQMGSNADLDEFAKRWLICTDLEEISIEVEKMVSAGFNEIMIFSSSPDERGFLAEFGRKTLPLLRQQYVL